MKPVRRRQISSWLPSQFLGSIREPEFWAYSSWLDIATRYRRTSLGLIWLCLPTAMFVLVLGNVYAHLMGYSIADYLPYLATGYLTWRFMLQVINDSISTLPRHKSFIMDGHTRLTDFVLRSFAKAGFYWFFGMLVVTAVLAWSPATDLINVLSLLLTFPLVVVNVAWLAVCLSLVGARFPDTHEFVSTVLVVGFLLTPILWRVDRFPPETIRGALVRFNPAFHLIEVVRAPILGQMPEATSVIVVVVMAVAGWTVATLLYRRYARYVPLWV